MLKVGLVVDIGNIGYREGLFAPLKPFSEPAPAAKSLYGAPPKRPSRGGKQKLPAQPVAGKRSNLRAQLLLRPRIISSAVRAFHPTVRGNDYARS